MISRARRIAVDISNSVKDIVLSRDPHRAADLANDDDDMDHLHHHPSPCSWTGSGPTESQRLSMSRSLAAITSGSPTTP